MDSELASPPQPTALLFVQGEPVPAAYSSLVSSDVLRIKATSQLPLALNYISRVSPSVVVTELDMREGDVAGLDVCRAAKSLKTPATVLVTTANPAHVPDALAMGCDAVLLKPFAPNLLVTRICRLLRERSLRLRLQAARSRGKAAHLSERTELLRSGTNREWQNTSCPYCSHKGVTSFDYTSQRRAWYACLDCRKVWIARRWD